jgi:hypothetical protein
MAPAASRRRQPRELAGELRAEAEGTWSCAPTGKWNGRLEIVRPFNVVRNDGEDVPVSPGEQAWLASAAV